LVDLTRNPQDRDYVATEYQLNELVLITHIGEQVSLRSIFVTISVYEDIFSPCLTGNVRVIDSSGLFDNLPIIGEEQIRLSFESTDPDNQVTFSKTFDVYEISNIEILKERQKSYTIKFFSPEMTRNLDTYVAKSYKGFTADAIVRSIMTSPAPYGVASDKELRTNKAKYEENLVVPYWRPFDVISFLQGRAISDSNEFAVDFVFFENRDRFNFVSLENLMKREPVQEFEYRTKMLQIKDRFSRTNITGYDVGNMEDLPSPMKGSTLITHDLLRKKLTETEFRYDFEERQHLSRFPAITQEEIAEDNPAKIRKVYPTCTYLFDDMPEENVLAEKWLQRHEAQLLESCAVKLKVDAPGDTKRTAGDVIRFVLYMPNPQNDAPDAEMVLNKYYSGNYLITSIHHYITQENYVQAMEIAKDSFDTTLEFGA
jgi:hypothetical protein